MQVFSDDRDILKYEPVLFSDLYMQSQIISKGINGSLSGVIFSKAGETFIDSGIKPGQVIYLSSPSLSAVEILEIVSVDSQNQLTLSMLRTSTEDAANSPCTSANDYEYRIATFRPQASETAYQLTQYFGIQPGNPDSEYSIDDIIDTEVLRQVSCFAVIANIYASRAAGLEIEDAYWDKSLYYRKRFHKALERCRLDIDMGNDGVKDLTRFSKCSKLVRD